MRKAGRDSVTTFIGVGGLNQTAVPDRQLPIDDALRIVSDEPRHAVRGAVTTATLSVGSRRFVLTGRYTREPFHANYDVAPDGKSFVFVRPVETRDATGLLVVLNWFASRRGGRSERAASRPLPKRASWCKMEVTGHRRPALALQPTGHPP